MPELMRRNAIIHILGIFMFLSLPVLFITGYPGEGDIGNVVLSPFYWLFCLSYLLLFYLNTYLLIPKLYLQKKYFYYFAAILLLFILFYYLQPFDHFVRRDQSSLHIPATDRPSPPGNMPDFPRERPEPPGGTGGPGVDIVSIFLFVMVVALGMAIKITGQWHKTRQQVTRAEADRAQAELSFLKAQINPHFLFNTLNNIYSLALTGNVKTADSIMKLSNIMRYVTDEVSQDFVPLQSEIDCIHDFIELQRLRTNKDSHIEFTVSGNTDNKSIAPLVLMTFVENIFKYGISKRESSTIIINLFAEERSITFYCRNKIFHTVGNAERTGIGIANTRKRLEHLYPDKHLLNIKNQDGFYSVELILLA